MKAYVIGCPEDQHGNCPVAYELFSQFGVEVQDTMNQADIILVANQNDKSLFNLTPDLAKYKHY